MSCTVEQANSFNWLMEGLGSRNAEDAQRAVEGARTLAKGAYKRLLAGLDPDRAEAAVRALHEQLVASRSDAPGRQARQLPASHQEVLDQVLSELWHNLDQGDATTTENAAADVVAVLGRRWLGQG